MNNKLDLHGIKHADVDILVEDFVLTNKVPMQIITGNSETMRKKTIKILDNHNFKWMIMAHNLGEIIVLG
jgi:hypothetical protein